MPTKMKHPGARGTFLPVLDSTGPKSLTSWILLSYLILASSWSAATAQSPTVALPDTPPDPARVDSPLTAPVDSLSGDSALHPPENDSTVPKVKKAQKKSAFRLYNIEDEKLLVELWRHAGREGRPDQGTYQVLVLNDSTAQVHLLRDGTQSGTLPPATQAWLRQRISEDVSQSEDGITRSFGAGFWGNFWVPGNWLAPYQWKTGLEASAGMDAGMFRRTTPLVGLHYDLVFTQRPEPWLTTEVGGHVSRYGGGPRRNLYNPLDNNPEWNAWGEYTPWWHAAIGVPGVKWEVALSNREFPEFYWIDPETGEGTYQRGLADAGLPVDTTEYKDGAVMANWNGREGKARPSNRNLSHSLHLKAGSFRYTAVFDGDVYRSTIHQLMFEEIRAPFGQIAVGFVTAEGASHSRVRLDLFPWNAGIGPTGARAHAHILRLNIDYRDPSTFHVGISTTFLFDAPFLRPGDSP